MIIDRKYLNEIGIEDTQKQNNFHSRFSKWIEQAMSIKINNTIDAIERIDKIKKMYDWVECEAFMYYYKHLNQEPSHVSIVMLSRFDEASEKAMSTIKWNDKERRTIVDYVRVQREALASQKISGT